MSNTHEIINGKLFIEEEYAISEFGNQVISKGQAIRHFEKKHPEYTVVAISSFKIDHQDETISVRVQVKSKPVVLLDDNQKPVALLNPGYDELAEKLKTAEAQIESENKLCRCGACADNVDLKERYNALVTAVAKDAQKFSDLLVENEHLKEAHEKLLEENKVLDQAVARHVKAALVEKQEIDYTPDDDTPDEKSKRRCFLSAEKLEDAADLADAKDTIKDDDSVPLPEIEGNVTSDGGTNIT